MKKLMAVIALLSVCILAIGCASDTEKAERRENAYDLSGSYKVSLSSKNEVGMQFNIINESGRHDIYVQLERTSPLTTKENELLKSIGVEGKAVYNHFFLKKKATLGLGYNKNHLEGGENISDDFGETSRFYVCSQPLKINSQTEVFYCLNGTVARQTKTLTGALSLQYSQTKTVKDTSGKPAETVSIGNTALKFASSIGLTYYKQFIGSWSGDLYISTSLLTNTQILNSLNVTETNSVSISQEGVAQGRSDELSFSLKTNQGLLFNGEQYNYDWATSAMDIEQIKKADYPSVHMTFTGPKGKRIVWVGQIWSLGDLTGSVIYIDDQKELDLGSFRYKKL